MERDRRPFVPKEQKDDQPKCVRGWVIAGFTVTIILLFTLVIMVGVNMSNNNNNNNPGGSPDKNLPPSLSCDVAIIGAGPGGLIMAQRLAEIYGNRLCVFDNRAQVGGKVQSKRLTTSSDTRPVWTPTHAEQLRGGDTILRCLSQELGTVMVNRIGTAINSEYQALGRNVTTHQCYGSQVPSATQLVTCDTLGTWEAKVAPNGEAGVVSPFGNDLLKVCGNQDWKSCSYFEEYLGMVLYDDANVATVKTSETFRQYCRRIIGNSATEYFAAGTSLGYMFEQDARSMIEYLLYDFDYAYGTIHMPHGGPQIGIWHKLARKIIVDHHTRIYLNRRIKSIDTNSNGEYVLQTGETSVTAKRVVIAFPPKYINTMSGSVVDSLKQTPYVTYQKPITLCTWNAFFPEEWWKYGAVCNSGFCPNKWGWNPPADIRENHTGYQFWDLTPDYDAHNAVGTLQYIPTPERKEGKLMRYFFDGEECDALSEIYKVSGDIGVQAEMMRRTKLKFNPVVKKPILNPVESYFRSSDTGQAGIAPGAPFTNADLAKWGAEPMPGRKICFATEGVNILDNGWQEGAAKAAHNCLRGNVFKDVIAASYVTSFETCKMGPYLNRTLSPVGSSGNDRCIAQQGEYNMRDLAGVYSCGSPSTYNYPTLASFSEDFSSFASSSIKGWENTVNTPVYEERRPRRVGRLFV